MYVISTVFFAILPLSYQIVKINPKDCPNNNYFDISHLQCSPCGENNVPSADKLNCKCTAAWKTIVNKGGPTVICQECPSNQMTTPDGWDCVPCEGNCNECQNDEVLNIRSVLGVLEPAMKCSKCTDQTVPSPQTGRCEPCNPSAQGYKCACSTPNILTGGLCFEPKELSDIPDAPSLYTVTFQGGVRLDSWYFKEHLRASAAACKASQNFTACQLISNLCVLLHYNRDANQRGGDGACDQYYKLASPSGQLLEWPPYMPQLYYLHSEPSTVLHKLDVEARYSFAPESATSKLDIVMAAYAVNGSFVGFVSTSGGLLQLCKNEQRILDAAYRFGRKYKQTCEINVRDFWNSHDLTFYDPYLQYTLPGNDKDIQLYPLPVINLNLESNGALVNTDEQSGRWMLTRRLFLVDNIGGKDSSGGANSTAKIVRYAEYVSINVELQTTKDGRIFPPFIKVKYNEVKLEQSGSVTVTFETNYFMSTQRHEKDIEITMGTLCSFAVLWAAVKAWSWSRRSGKAAVDFVTILKFLIFMGVSIANVFLVVMIAMSLWILVVYKRQRTPILMMPTADQEYSFLVYFGLATAIKIIEMVHFIIVQVTAEVFFIDWERPRGFIIPRNGEQGGGLAPDGSAKTPSPVTIWRTYFVANEWNEMQCYRKTSYVFQLFSMLFFLKVLNFEALALIEPDATMRNVPREYCDSRMSRFAVAASLYLGIGFFQWFVNVFIVERCISDHFRSFVDLCSISNVSVLILLHRQFGYYIHGRSVHGHADTDMKEMNEMLQRERDNLCSQRGLEPNTDQQTFIACFPHKFRVQYDRVLSTLTAVMHKFDFFLCSSSCQLFIKPSRGAETRLTGTDQATAKTEGVVQVYEQMNHFLTSFIDHVAVEADYIIKDRTMLEAVFDMEFQDTNQKGVFYRDPSDSSFGRASTYGNEYCQLTFDLCIFCMTDLIAHNFIIATVVSYLIFTVIKIFRKSGVRRSLIRTSLVDQRFLI